MTNAEARSARLRRYAVAALAQANEIRFKLGVPPQPALLPGIPRNSCNCPLARTIAADIDGIKIEVSSQAIQINGTGRVYLDDDTSNFVSSFDTIPNSTYPELVAPEGRFLRPFV